MTGPGDNKPPRAILELDDEMYEFILRNCDANIRVNMGILQLIHDGKQPDNLAGPVVEITEQFRRLRKLTEEAGK